MKTRRKRTIKAFDDAQMCGKIPFALRLQTQEKFDNYQLSVTERSYKIGNLLYYRKG